MSTTPPASESKDFALQALGKGAPANFEVTFDKETEIAGHPTANLVYSVPKRADGSAPKDIDVFLTLRHFDANGREIYYTGTAGDPVPLCKGKRNHSLDASPLAHHRSVSIQDGFERRCEKSTNHLRVTKNTYPTGNMNRQTCLTSNLIPSTTSWSNYGLLQWSFHPAIRSSWKSTRVTVKDAVSFCITSPLIGKQLQRFAPSSGAELEILHTQERSRL